MAAGKWIGGILGFMAGGTLGALAGIAIGAMFDSFVKNTTINVSDSNNDPFSRQQLNEGQRNSFLFSILVLASYIVKADGKIMHSEMEFVRSFLRTNFGDEAVAQGEQIMLRLFDEQKRQDSINPNNYKSTIRQCCIEMSAHFDYSQRLQLLNFLTMIAQADGYVSPEEIVALREVAQYMGMSAQEVNSMLNLKGETLEDAYKILEISPDASDDEVRSAYRKLALKHHPDRVATLGEDVKKAAEVKFKEITDARDRIFKDRGL